VRERARRPRGLPHDTPVNDLLGGHPDGYQPGPGQCPRAVPEPRGVVVAGAPIGQVESGGWPASLGNSTSRRVPCPRRLSTRSVPPVASTRSFRPTSPEPRAGSAPPDPVIADADPNQPVEGVDLDLHHRGAGMLGHVRQRFGHDVVGGHLDPLGQPPLGSKLQLDRDRATAGQGPQGRPQAALGQDRRVDAAGELAQLLQRPIHAGGDPVQLGRQLLQPGRDRRLGGAELQGQRDQPLLGPVVQVALDAAAGLVGGGDDTGP